MRVVIGWLEETWKSSRESLGMMGLMNIVLHLDSYDTASEK